jgi:uncharacterized membrane protein YccC
LLLVKRPRREIGVLLMELRMASNAALDVAVRPGQSALLHTRLARIDTICTAIESWQENYPTELHIAVDAETLDGLVLNARVTTEECCYELSRCANSATMEHTRLEAAISRFHAVLAEPRIRKKAAAEKMAAAKLTATAVPVRADHPLTEKSDLDFAEYLIGCGIDAQLRLREIDLTRGLIAPARKAAPARESNRTGLIAAGVRSTPQPDQRAAPVSAPNKPFWTPWRAWAPTSRMAVQTMIAAIIASGVGELISASHWYWAVMTAFVVFIGATSRSGILTRALRRVTGTVLGIAVGIALVALAAGSTNALVAICVLAVFGMLYFGPLNYAHSAFFLTVMLVAMYRLLGVLNANLVELRIEETLAGAVIGVICAYGILSTSSKPLLVGKLDDYFSALEDALQSLAVALPRTARNRKLRATLHALETAQGELDQTVSGMVTAFVVSGVRRETRAVNLMHIVTGSLARLVQLDSVHSLTPTAEAIATVAASAQQARHILGTFQARDGSPGGAQRLLSRESLAVRSRSGDPIGPRSSYDEALVALGRMQWALEQVSIVWLRN